MKNTLELAREKEGKWKNKNKRKEEKKGLFGKDVKGTRRRKRKRKIEGRLKGEAKKSSV